MSFKSYFNYEGKNDQNISTVWLLSLLNKRQLLPKQKGIWTKVSKKDILEVSIPTTCHVIKNDPYPLQLKQISHLLYGISLCYCKKSEFVLEDLSVLLTQIHKSFTSKERVIENGNISRKYLNPLKYKHNIVLNNENFFQDDNLFNISDIESFELFLTKIDIRNYQKVESVQIKKNDFLNELRNYNILPNPRADVSDHQDIVRNFTLEELPVDFSLDLNFEDIISQQGTTRSTSSLTHKNNQDIHFREESRYFGDETNFNNEEVNPILDFDLEVSSDRTDHKISSKIQRNQNFTWNSNKKRKLDNKDHKNRGILKKIKFDSKISILKETLKTNHETYVEIMGRIARKSSKNISKTVPQFLFSNDNTTKLINKCWSFLLSKDLYPFLHKSIPYSSFQTNDDSSNIDTGRKLVNLSERSNLFLDNEDHELFRQDENISNNVLLHLDQIEEDLNEENLIPYSESIENGLEFMRHPLNLLPSSIGHYSTRTSSTNSAQQRPDFIDVLKLSKNMNNNNILEEKDQYTSSFDIFDNKIQKNMDKLRNCQSKKFYSYLCNKFYDLKGDTKDMDVSIDILPNNGLAFSYIIPDRIEDFETKKFVPMTKQLAANAFFSLLDLASQEIIDLRVPESVSVPITLETFRIIV